MLKKWKGTTSGIAIGLICHFVLVAMIGVWHRRHATSRTAAQAWFDRASSALLIVPSAIVPEETNVLINPAHPDSRRITARKIRKWLYDPRLVRRG